MTVAREAARQMLVAGDMNALLDLGEQKGALRISTDPGKVTGSEKFDIDGQTVYIGFPSEEMN